MRQIEDFLIVKAEANAGAAEDEEMKESFVARGMMVNQGNFKVTLEDAVLFYVDPK